MSRAALVKDLQDVLLKHDMLPELAERMLAKVEAAPADRVDSPRAEASRPSLSDSHGGER